MNLDRAETDDRQLSQSETDTETTPVQPRQGDESSNHQGGTEAAAVDWTWADPATLRIEPAFQWLIPLQSRGELLALEESIQAEGCRDPLLVWQGRNIVLDGHTRLICVSSTQSQ